MWTMFKSANVIWLIANTTQFDYIEDIITCSDGTFFTVYPTQCGLPSLPLLKSVPFLLK